MSMGFIKDGKYVQVAGNPQPPSTSDKQYINDQNELSDYESITLSTSTTTMPYDGVIEVSWSVSGNEGTGFDRAIYISGNAAARVIGKTPDAATRAVVLNAIFRKGDPITISNTATSARVRYYKKRDYSMR